MVEQWNNDGGTVEQRWWNSGTMMVEQGNSKLLWNSGTMMVEQWKRYGGTVQQ